MPRTVGRQISILYRISRIYLSDALQPFGLTAAEFPFLLYLYEHDGATQDAMSSYLIIDKAATTRAIRTLEAKGYVRRDKDSQDKRCNRVSLCPKARRHEEGIKETVYSWTKEVTGPLDDASQDALYDALARMVTEAKRLTVKKGDPKRERK